MRILLVNMHGADRSVGGAERYVADLAAGLVEGGAEVSLLAAFPGAHDGPYERVETLHDADWRESAARRVRNRLGDADARPSRRLEHAVAAARPDVVHTNNLPGITTAVWEVAGRLGVPVVHTLHDYYLLCARSTLVQADGTPCRPRALLCGVRAARLGRWAGRVGAVIGVSRHLLDRHGDVFPGTVARHVVVHPVEAGSAAPGPKGERLGTLGYLGSLDVVKGVDQLLGALPELRDLGVELRVAGGGRLREGVEEAAAAGQLRYDGIVDGAAKDAFLAGCDAGVVPSVWEEPGAPPYVAVEWLLAGRPVLASDRGGLGEAAAELPGLVPVPPTSAGIAAGARALLEPGAWRAAVAAAGRPIGAPDDRSRWLDDHRRVYESVLAAVA